MKRKKRWVLALLMALCILSLTELYSYVARASCSFVITGTFSGEQSDRFAAMLNSNDLIASSASYKRENWVALEDEHQRRMCYADLILAFGEYTPVYPFHILFGRFLRPGDKNRIVLAAEQASELFCTYQCEGSTVLVNGTAYTVTGVYQPYGAYAKLSCMGLTEAYISSDSPLTHWLITAARGKEAQLAFSLEELLAHMGVSDIFTEPVYRSRGWLFFWLYAQITLWGVLFCIRLWKRKQAALERFAPWTKALSPRFLILLAVCLVLALLRGLPMAPTSLPTTLSWAAVRDQARVLLCQWNTRVITPCMEMVYDKWLTIGGIAHFVVFWLLYGLLKKEGAQCVNEWRGL